MNKLVGLGNVPLPNTRHNVGMMVLDHIAHCHNLSWTTHLAWDSDITQKTIILEKNTKQIEYTITLLKPNKTMNISGSCVAQAVKDLSVPLDKLYLFHDDMQRDLGKVNIKRTGSANGHNGVKSVIEHLASTEFNRYRIGIGRPPLNDDRSYDIVRSHVLGLFTESEMEILKKWVYPMWENDLGSFL
ncbi:peptidyl-tRNA hydrolase [Backusella circina FSU 941]|nr:peptidyl-tRNA hydrolase [Backusella circina FSU 941]